METIPPLLPLPADGQDAFRAAAPEARHIFLPTDDRGGLRDLAPELFQQTTILFGFVPPDRLRRFSHLKWVQSWNAGVDSYLAPGVLPEGAMLTSAAGAYGPAVSEHMLAMLLALYKRLPTYRDQQSSHIWADRGPVSTLHGKTVLIGGAGDIGRHFALLARALGASRILGLCRSARDVQGFDQVYALDALDMLLPKADVVALALPHAPETVRLLDRRRLMRMKPRAVLLNAGRGSAVDCAALAELLSAGHLLGAGLDVTDPEPLPPDHPLWDAPNVLITPHTAGGYNHMQLTLDRIRALFLDNLKRYVAGEPLRNRMR